MFTELNGSQFRQIYSSFSFQSIHPQTLHEHTHGMHNDQTEVISNWASLFFISFFEKHSSVPMKHNRNSNSIHSILILHSTHTPISHTFPFIRLSSSLDSSFYIHSYHSIHMSDSSFILHVTIEQENERSFSLRTSSVPFSLPFSHHT